MNRVKNIGKRPSFEEESRRIDEEIKKRVNETTLRLSIAKAMNQPEEVERLEDLLDILTVDDSELFDVDAEFCNDPKCHCREGFQKEKIS